MNNELLQQYIKANPKWKLKDVVVQLMYDQIINLKILPATKLNINQLAQSLGISRTPVAEAVGELMEKGLIVNRDDNPGYYVMNLNINDMIDLYRVRTALECEAAAVCTERASAQVIRELEELAGHFTQFAQKRDQEGMTDADMPFHRLIVDSSEDPYIVKCYDLMVPYLSMYQKAMTRAVATDRDNPWYSSVIYNHEAIASAIKMHIPELARTAMKDHINASLNYSSYTKNNILFG
ncbi:MAG: GntR family transcriptional regulator [Oscillospiraceae bacterium]|nr:GntR family transcriptional regulator [Oscillospiraceae bacterium]